MSTVMLRGRRSVLVVKPFLTYTQSHKREAAQKADLHFARPCKSLVSKYFYFFKSK